MNILLENLDLFTIRIIISQKIKYIYIKIIKLYQRFELLILFFFYFILFLDEYRIEFDSKKLRIGKTIRKKG